MTVALVVLGAVVGAPLRYLTDLFVQSRFDGVFPWGTLLVNVSGSFVVGVLAAGVSLSSWPTSLAALVGTGLCGALTTFSTFSYETLRLLEDGSWVEALLNVGAGVTAGLLACSAGWELVSWRVGT